MFDLRYHVASLAAVFLALIIGILVGVGISDRGLLDKTKHNLLEHQVANLRKRLDDASRRSALGKREQRAAESYITQTYPVLVHNRLLGKNIAVVFVGSVDGAVNSALERSLTDAGAQQVRMRALKMPVDDRQVDARLAAAQSGHGYIGRKKLESLGRALGEELVAGGETPLWNTLTDTLVEERLGGSKLPADGVVVVRTVPPQRNGTSRFLFGLYQGVSSLGLPAVGVETTDAAKSAVDIFSKAGLSSVDDIDQPSGRLALVFLLAGAPTGKYGVKPSADDVLPAFPPPAPRGG
jgi:hypothetical protein